MMWTEYASADSRGVCALESESRRRRRFFFVSRAPTSSSVARPAQWGWTCCCCAKQFKFKGQRSTDVIRSDRRDLN